MEYDKNRIEKLLERWENGETSLAEEAEIKKLLSTQITESETHKEAVVNEKAFNAMFSYFNAVAKLHSNKTLSIPELNSPYKTNVRRIKRIWSLSLTVAALFAIGTIVSLKMIKQDKEPVYICQIDGYIINDKEIVQEQFQAALSILNAGFYIINSPQVNYSEKKIMEALQYLEQYKNNE